MKKLLLISVVIVFALVLTSCWPGSIPLVPKSLLIDDTHNNAVDDTMSNTLAKLIQTFQAKGYSVSLASSAGFVPEQFGAVLIPAPRNAYNTSEKNKLSTLLSLGGKVILLGEWYPYYNNAPMNAITSALGVNISFNNNVLLDNVNNYQSNNSWVTTTKFEAHPLSAGLSKIVLFSGCTLNTGVGVSDIARAESTSYTPAALPPDFPTSSAGAEMDLTGLEFEPQVTIVVPLVAAANVGFGKVVAVGDINIFGNDTGGDIAGDFIDVYSNRRLLENIINW